MRAVAPIVVAILGVLGSASRAQEAGLDAALRRAGEYVARYETQAVFVLGHERYRQKISRVVSGRQAFSGVRAPAVRVEETRDVIAEILLIRSPHEAKTGFPWMEFRNVLEVDGDRQRDSDARLADLTSYPPEIAIPRAIHMATESARFNIGAVRRNINLPTLALMFLHPVNQRRFSFEHAGEKTVDGVKAWRLRFVESARPTLIRTTDAADSPTQGSVWIDPELGTVVRTELRNEIRGSRSEGEVTVTYRADPKVGLWMPFTMKERYVDEPSGTYIECEAKYSNYRRFEVETKLVIPD